MKKLFLFIPILICVLGWAVWTARSQNEPPKERYIPSYNTEVTVPVLPENLDFAGERVPLENFDTRESLTREMLVTMYMHSRTSLTLLNTRRYFAVIEPILKEYGVPDDFKYLCMAESGLDPETVSSAGAAGLWQIMKGTGKDYGLEVCPQLDERYHLEKSTIVACKYLLEAYEKFGSWTLAAASYNMGQAGLAKRLEKQGTENYYDTFLPYETLRYVFRILSFKVITENPAAYGYTIAESDYYKPLDNWYYTYVNDKEIVWSDVAHENCTTYKMVRRLNPWIRDYEHANKPGKQYEIKMPGPDFRQAELNEAYAECDITVPAACDEEEPAAEVKTKTRRNKKKS